MNQLAGQWLGTFDGSNTGIVTLNFDADRPDDGIVLIADDDPAAGDVVARFSFVSDGDSFDATTTAIADPTAPNLPPPENLPKQIVLKGVINGDVLSGSWTTERGTSGGFAMFRSESDKTLAAEHTFDSWKEFEDWVRQRRSVETGLVYRGLERNTYALTTTFHRTARRDLVRYTLSDIGELHRAMAPLLPYKIDLERVDDYTSFVYLARHHGFPTPILDWTESHLVAAYFAFHQGSLPANPPSHVRILEFDLGSWTSGGREYVGASMFLPQPSFSIVRAIPFGNSRALPQQSIAMFSNVSDIERLVRQREMQTGFSYLRAVDLNFSLRDEVITHLKYSGITPATMFPGLDGTCRAMALKLFEHRDVWSSSVIDGINAAAPSGAEVR